MAKKTYIRKLQRVSSDSYTLNIPKEIVDHFGWREKQKLELTLTTLKRSISVKDYRK